MTWQVNEQYNWSLRVGVSENVKLETHLITSVLTLCVHPYGKFLEGTRKGSNLLRAFASSAFFLSCAYFFPLQNAKQADSRLRSRQQPFALT